MAIVPTRQLDIEFDAGTWTDVSADLVAATTHRGRNRELGAFETGQMVFTLRNDSRKYDPDHAAGTYYGKLRANRRIRFRGTYNAVTYPVIVGYIDRITQQYGGPNDAAALFQVSDLFKLLNRAELRESVWVAEILADAPQAWYRLGDPVGAGTAEEEISGLTATVAGAGFTFGTAGLISRDGDSAAIMNSDATIAAGSGIQRSGGLPAGTGDFTIEFLLRTTQIPTNSVPILEITGGTSADYFNIGLTANFTGLSGIQVQHGTTVSGPGLSVPVNDGNPRMVTVKRASGTVTVYIDGTVAGTTFAAGESLGPNWFFGSPSVVAANVLFGATLDELAIYPTALSDARVAAHWNARKVGGQWAGDLPGPRLARILDLAAVPAGDRNLDAGTTTLQPTSLGGTALAYAQKVEDTEAGELFVTRDGKVRFLGRDASVTGGYLTSLATFVDADSGAGIGYLGGGSADVDEGIMVTRATVSRDGGTAATYYDAAAKAEFGWLDATHDGLLHASDAYSASYAQWIVATHKTPSSRVGTLAVELAGDPAANIPALLALEIGDRVTYKRKPQNAGSVITQDMRIESIAHDTGGGYWRTILQLSPFNLGEGGWPVGVWDVTNWDQSVWGI